MAEYYDTILNGADFLRNKLGGRSPEIGLILGSGWGSIVEHAENQVSIHYKNVPGMAVSTTPGHAGAWICGDIGGKCVLVMNGRLHPYEGHSSKDVIMPIYIMKELGVKTLVVTNAAGAINKSFSPGDIMIITDHINYTGLNPLTGENDDHLGTRFPDMSKAYDPELVDLALKTALSCGITARPGVYVQSTGPSFETPAEIRMFRSMGADAIGMSTVPEVIAARHACLRIAGLSCMTNMAAGVLDQPLSHAEVLEAANKVRDSYRSFMESFIKEMK